MKPQVMHNIHLECNSHLDIHYCALDRVPEYTIVFTFSYTLICMYVICMDTFMIQMSPSRMRESLGQLFQISIATG